MIKWWDWLVACLFSYFIYTNAFLAVALTLQGNLVFSLLCGASAWVVNNMWNTWYIPFRVALENQID